MHQVYRKAMNETGTVASNDLTMQSNETISTAMNLTYDLIAPEDNSTSTEKTLDADYTNMDMGLDTTPAANTTDSDVEIVEWVDIEDIKPHIKPEL